MFADSSMSKQVSDDVYNDSAWPYDVDKDSASAHDVDNGSALPMTWTMTQL